MGSLSRKAVWGAAIVWLLLPAVGIASQGRGKHGKLDSILAQADRTGGSQRVIIRTKSGSTTTVGQQLQMRGAKLVRKHALVNGFTAVVNADDLAVLAMHPDVESISADVDVRAQSKRTSGAAQGSWDSSTFTTVKGSLGIGDWFNGSSTTVALIDSGIQDGPDFTGRIVGFYDFTKEGIASAPYDDYGHGTHVAGLIGSNGTTSAKKYEGVAPGVKFLGLKVLDKKGLGKTSNVIAALEFAVANRARFNVRVINLSLGHPIYEPAMTDPLVHAVEAAVRAGMVVVVAAGNNGTNPTTGLPGYGGVTSPGNAPSAITVGAASTNNTVARGDDRVTSFSSRGPSWYDGIAKPDLVAPGAGLVSNEAYGSTIASIYPWLEVREGTAKYLKLSGSSMAAGIVTGLAVVMIEANQYGAYQRWSAYQDTLRRKDRTDWTGVPRLTPNAVKAMLQFTATSLKDDGGVTYDALTQGTGMVNGLGAVSLAYYADTTKPDGSAWLTHSVPPVTTYDGVEEAWSQSLVWGTRTVYGSSLMDLYQTAWDENIVWGSGEFGGMRWGTYSEDAENIVWGSSFIGGDFAWFGFVEAGENIVWGSMAEWDENIVWGSSLVGVFDGENIVWGSFDAGADENIVWGSLDDENTVWGSSNKVSVLGSALVGGGR
jgi:serine protease AprX